MYLLPVVGRGGTFRLLRASAVAGRGLPEDASSPLPPATIRCMDVPDIYLDAAIAEITLVCDRCRGHLDSEDLPGGHPRFAGDGWFVALANEAHQRGWVIEYSGPDANYCDYRILCPECARHKSD